jgi:hypothetical protein
MARPMSAAMLAAFTSQAIQPAIFVMATFRTGPIYVWSGSGNITWNGQTWTGIGSFGGVSSIEEGADIQARGITLTTSAFDSSLLGDVLNEFQLGLPVIVYIALFSTGGIVSDPLTAWAGRMDQPVIDIGANTAVISIACENRMVDMNTPAVYLFTNDTQQLFYPGDQGFSFVLGLIEQSIYWGASPLSPNNM